MRKNRLKWIIPASLAAAAAVAAVAIFWPRADVPAGRSATRTDDWKRERIEELYAEYRASFPDVPQVTVAQLLTESGVGKVVIVDSRATAEQEVSMIPGAIPASQFDRQSGRYKDRKVVVYCTIGYRSGLYAKKLVERGYRAANLKGGILAWVHAGQSVAGRGGPTNRVHVYGRKWDLVPRGYEAVW